MVIKTFMALLLVLHTALDVWIYQCMWKQRRKPLPASVADVYDETRYQTFIDYKTDCRMPYYMSEGISLGIDLLVLFSPFYAWMDQHTANVYTLTWTTALLLLVINAVITAFFAYHRTFFIEQKYGLNKRTKKEFWKDYLIDTGMDALITVCVLSFITFVCEHISSWTGQFSYTYGQTFLLCVGLGLIGFVIMLVLSLLSMVALMAQYTFTDLEDGPLRQRIMELQKDSKKKVKRIKVYNESKKTNSKNAFLMKLLWFRMFGIADNFILENAQNELYAVLSHEIGHLKHKKDIYNYSKYGILALGFLLVVGVASHPAILWQCNAWVQNAFGSLKTNYYLVLYVMMTFFEPVSMVLSVYFNAISRREEKEADMNAVKEGYGRELIDTFKKISDDELVDLNPPRIVEVLKYDHPSMVHRIEYIERAMEEQIC